MNKNTKEKICAFYASDYHFEMVSLPYIDKKLDNKDEVIILTENDLEETIKILLDNTNFKEDKKKKILKIDWKNNDLEKFKDIKKILTGEKEIVIFIKGKEGYIKKTNENIEKYIQKEQNIKIIDCYNVEEIGENLDIVMSRYRKILKTTGEKEIDKI